MAAVAMDVLSNILGSSRTRSCCYNSIQLLNQDCHQVLLKHSREAGMDEKKDKDCEVVDIMPYSKNMCNITFKTVG